MSNKWNHPEFGSFESSHFGWHTTIQCERIGKVSLTIDAPDFSRDPVSGWRVCGPPRSVAVALLVDSWKRCDHIVTSALEYLFGEISGAIKTCNWWGAPEAWNSVNNKPTSVEQLATALVSKDFIFRVRHFPEVTGEPPINPFTKQPVESDSLPDPRPSFWAIELCFDAEFEHEHGVGVLWHKGRIISTGYGYGDVSPPRDYQP
jgi:hypothetical protein